MHARRHRTLCWVPTWSKSQPGVGIEHLHLGESDADSVVVAVDDERGPFRLSYRLHWSPQWQIMRAELSLLADGSRRSLCLQTDGQGRWKDGDDRSLARLDGCMDIDIWPTPFTNSFPIRRQPLAIGQAREFRVAWVNGPDLSVQPQEQRYTRIADRLYRFESLDGSGFEAELPVDQDGLVLDYPGLFRRADRDQGT